MSYIFKLKSDDIVNKLCADGIMGPGELYSEHKGDFVHFDNIIDDERVLNDICIYPLTVVGPDTLEWTTNHFPNFVDSPAYAISKKYPDAIFKFTSISDGHFNYVYQFQCLIKDGNEVTQDGRNITATLAHIRKNKESLYKELDRNKVRISIPYNPADKYFANIYVDKRDLLPFSKDSLSEDDYCNVCFTSDPLTPSIPVYRTLGNGEKLKELTSPQELIVTVERERARYSEEVRNERREYYNNRNQEEEYELDFD